MWRRRIVRACGGSCARFGGREFEVALEATTGWRFVVEELRRIGAVVHLAEPAETAGLRGSKKRAKNDRADAQASAGAVDGRTAAGVVDPARSHPRSARPGQAAPHAVEQRGEWQQRIQAVLYHHGCPRRRELMTRDGRAWLDAQALPEPAREQVRSRPAMIDVSSCSSRRWTSSWRLRAPPDRLQGADGPLRDRGADRGHDPRRARRRAAASPPPVRRSVTPGWMSPSANRIGAARPDASRVRGRRRCAGRCMRPRRSPGEASVVPIASTTWRPRSGSAATARASRSRASCSSAHTTRCASSARRRWHPHDLLGARQAPRHADAPRPAPGMLPPPRPRGRPTKDRAAATLTPAGSPDQTSCRRPGANPSRGPK